MSGSEPSPTHSVAVVGAVMRDDGLILAIRRRDNGEWQPPGGVLELGETIEDGLRREVFEETGVHVEPVALTGVYKNMVRHVVALAFRCVPVSGEPHPTDEAAEVRWFTVEEVRGQMTPAFATRITDALTDAVTIRTHNGVDILS